MIVDSPAIPVSEAKSQTTDMEKALSSLGEGHIEAADEAMNEYPEYWIG